MNPNLMQSVNDEYNKKHFKLKDSLRNEIADILAAFYEASTVPPEVSLKSDRAYKQIGDAYIEYTSQILSLLEGSLPKELGISGIYSDGYNACLQEIRSKLK